MIKGKLITLKSIIYSAVVIKASAGDGSWPPVFRVLQSEPAQQNPEQPEMFISGCSYWYLNQPHNSDKLSNHQTDQTSYYSRD